MTRMNETVLITGVAQGIGRGLAIAYAEKGYRVIGCDVNEEKKRSGNDKRSGWCIRAL